MNPRSLAANTTALLLIQVANQLVPLVTLPYLTRTLGVETYGAYAYAMAITTLACVLTDFGFTLWATGEVARYRDDRDRVTSIYGAVTASKVGLAALSVVLVSAYAAFSAMPAEHKIVIYLTALPILGLTLQPIWLFNGLEQMSWITFIHSGFETRLHRTGFCGYPLPRGPRLAHGD